MDSIYYPASLFISQLLSVIMIGISDIEHLKERRTSDV